MILFKSIKKGFQLFLLGVGTFCATSVKAQSGYWQQQIQYDMDVNLNTKTNILNGTQKITYTNNSSDTLRKLFIHLYWNAFQPNSSMDVRSQELGETVLRTDRDGSPVLDWDARVRDRISRLSPSEIGYSKVKSLKIDGVEQELKEYETILEVRLSKPVLPKSGIVINTVFENQVPVQIRRAGRHSAEGVDFSMTQWYPKVAEYDFQGWNANPYIAREFHGVWGNFNVNITLDKNYKIGASGNLLNAAEIGWGYDGKEGSALKPSKTATRTWKFRAENVHDFAWAADPNYKHITRQVKDGPLLRFIYLDSAAQENAWQKSADTLALATEFINATFGKYPWNVYSVIQGGDGGMEYAMSTLVKSASIGTMIHELMHSWYQQLMATNESLYYWMDEGFTVYAETRTSQWLRNKPEFAQKGSYTSYYNLVRSRREEPMGTHADHYNSNYAYSNAAYSKGAVFLTQLGYIIGDKALDKVLHNYYNEWKFKHPTPNDFIRVAEKTSDIELKWYKDLWINTTRTIDYKIDSIWMENNKTNVRIKNLGSLPMPVDVSFTLADGTKQYHYKPLNLMYGAKPSETNDKWVVYEPQLWTHRTFVVSIDQPLNKISKIEIDDSERLADIDRSNNKIITGF